MDITLINASVFELPVSRRAGAIVYDGTRDLSLWRPPGPDRELLYAYGDTLQSVLDKEQGQVPGGELDAGEARRLHPGKLRCDYLIWVGGREPHGETESSPAPPLDEIERMATSALELAARHDTVRVAFGPLGDGQGAAPTADRLAAVVRGADAFRKARRSAGRASSVEEVLVCARSATEVAKAKRLVARVARQVAAPNPEPARAPTRTRRSASGGSGKSRASSKSRTPQLDPAELTAARARADAYSPQAVYSEGDWFVHPKFGVGQVRRVLGPERMIYVLFEDGQERRLVHAR
ncbi:MAG: hypothetical protein PVI30_27405 [Myxococcales bacterium]